MGRDLYHSSEGQTWRKHKYIRKEGNRYIYPEDIRSNNEAARKAAQPAYNRKPARDVISRNGAKRVNRYVDRDGDFRSIDIIDKYGRQRNLNKSPYGTTWNSDEYATLARTNANVYRKDFNKTDRSNQFSEKKQSSINRVSSKNAEERKSNSHKLVANGGKAEHTKKQLNDSHDQAKKDVSKLNTSGFVAMHQPKNFDKNGNPKRWRSTVNMNREAEAKAEDRFKKNAKTAVPASVKDQQRSVRMDERRRNSSNQMPESDRRSARQVQNREAAANGNIIGKNGKVYTFRQDQDYAKRNTGGKKSEQYRRDYAQNEDGSYGAKEGQYWEWTTDKHTHSSEAARKAGIEKKAYEAEVKEAVKKTKARNKAEKEKLTKKGKQIVDKIKSTFSKKTVSDEQPVQTTAKKKNRTARDILSDRGIIRREVVTDTAHDFNKGKLEHNPNPRRYYEKDIYKDGLTMNKRKNYEKDHAKKESMRRMNGDRTDRDYGFDSTLTNDKQWLKEVNDKWIKNRNKKKK